jgi:hypothetical protein
MLEWVGMMNTNLTPREAQLSFLREVRRVLSDKGCLYIGVENRFGLQFLLGTNDHSGLPYTSLIPRSIASILVRKYGHSGGIYGDKTIKQKEKRGYYTYTYSILGYSSLFKQARFKFKSYWVIPGYDEPYFSGNLDDKIGLKGFMQYIKNITTRTKFKVALSILEKLDKYILCIITSLFIPSFLFYCYKNEVAESFDNIIASNTLLKSYTVFSGAKEIAYILYNKKGKPVKIVRLKRYGCHLPTTMPFRDKTLPNSYGQLERAWMESWIDGRRINPLKFNEAQMAIEWLIDFQNKTRSTAMTKNDIYSEVNAVRTNLLQLPNLNIPLYRLWLDDYESYIGTLNINRTSEHGDFFFGNILIDSKTQKVNVIDWEYFRERGDPFFDFVFFIICAMQSPGYSADEFQQNLNGCGKFSHTMDKLQCKINNHFGFKLDMDKVIPYTTLRYIVRNQLERGTHDKMVILFNKTLNIISSKI